MKHFEILHDQTILEDNLIDANMLLQDALHTLDHLLQESTATAYGHKREPNHKRRCADNAKALNKAHDEIAEAKKGLFQFKLKHGEI